jgi:hypothetical protein
MISIGHDVNNHLHEPGGPLWDAPQTCQVCGEKASETYSLMAYVADDVVWITVGPCCARKVAERVARKAPNLRAKEMAEEVLKLLDAEEGEG